MAARLSSQSERLLRTRPPLERMQWLHERLAAHRPVTAAQAAAELEVSDKTIRRDLEFMRERYELPVEWDAASGTYRYTQAVGSFPGSTTNEGDLVALVMAQKALESLRAHRWSRTLKRLAREIEATLASHPAATRANGAAITIGQAPTPAPLEVLPMVAQAVWEKRLLRFVYQKPNQGERGERTLEPWYLREHEGMWYVLGWDRARQADRAFALARMSEVKIGERCASTPPPDRLRHWLESSFGVRDGSAAPKTVQLRASGWAVSHIAERRWHASQQLRTEALPNGETVLYLTFHLGDFAELQRWILGWGSCVEVLSPPALRDEVAATARAMAEKNAPVGPAFGSWGVMATEPDGDATPLALGE